MVQGDCGLWDSSATAAMGHSRPLVRDQRSDLHGSGQYFRDGATDDAGLRPDRSGHGVHLFRLRVRLRALPDSRRMAGRSLGRPGGASRRAGLVVLLHRLDGGGGHPSAGHHGRDGRCADRRALSSRRWRSRGPAEFQPGRGRLDSAGATRARYRHRDRRHRRGRRNHPSPRLLGHGELLLADGVLPLRLDRPRGRAVVGARLSRAIGERWPSVTTGHLRLFHGDNSRAPHHCVGWC